jgi:hypothetical protein
MAVSKLLLAGEIQLEAEMKRKLRQRFGDLVDRALTSSLDRFVSIVAYLPKPDLYWLKRRFVHAHEISHEMLPLASRALRLP